MLCLHAVRPTVSYHAHTGPVKFLMPVYCGHCSLYPPSADVTLDADVKEEESFVMQSEQVAAEE